MGDYLELYHYSNDLCRKNFPYEHWDFYIRFKGLGLYDRSFSYLIYPYKEKMKKVFGWAYLLQGIFLFSDSFYRQTYYSYHYFILYAQAGGISFTWYDITSNYTRKYDR